MPISTGWSRGRIGTNPGRRRAASRGGLGRSPRQRGAARHADGLAETRQHEGRLRPPRDVGRSGRRPFARGASGGFRRLTSASVERQNAGSAIPATAWARTLSTRTSRPKRRRRVGNTRPAPSRGRSDGGGPRDWSRTDRRGTRASSRRVLAPGSRVVPLLRIAISSLARPCPTKRAVLSAGPDQPLIAKRTCRDAQGDWGSGPATDAMAARAMVDVAGREAREPTPLAGTGSKGRVVVTRVPSGMRARFSRPCRRGWSRGSSRRGRGIGGRLRLHALN